MNKILKKVLLLLSLPLRYSIRYELHNTQIGMAENRDTILQRMAENRDTILQRMTENRDTILQRMAVQDIGMTLNRRAAESTANYVEKNMKNVDSVSTNFELLSKAMKEANLDNNLLICEFGVHSGTTINHIASLSKFTVYGFDSFEGLPERWRDGFGKGHFKVDTLPKVQQNVVLIKGWFNETLPSFIKEHEQYAGLIHIDCDLYSSTKTIFEELEDKIHQGCVIVFDEYFNYPGWEDGEYKAFCEFIERTGLTYEYIGYNRLHEQVAVKITGRQLGAAPIL